MIWASLEMFSERRFGGWRVFLTRLVLLSWVVGFVSELVEARSSLVPFDVMTVLMVWPGMIFLLTSLLALACVRLWRVSFVSALGGLASYLPVLFFIPVFNFLLQGAGFSPEMGFANGWQALTVLLTGGVLPLFTVPPAFVLTWILCLGWLAWSWWRVASMRRPWELVQGLLPGYLGFPLLFLLPSFIGWSVIVGDVPIWSGLNTIVGQGFIAAQIDGFAWRAVYERFPLAIGGEAHVSQTWLFAVFTWSVSLIVVFYQLVRNWRWSAKQFMSFIGRRRVMMGLGVVALGAAGAFLFKEGHILTWTHILAFLMLMIVTGLFILVQAAETELLEATHGSLAADRPLATGAVRSADLAEASWIWSVAAAAGALMLGMAPFLAFVFAYISHRQALSARHPWAFLSWMTLPFAGYFLAGWMMVAERGSFGALAPALASLVFLAIFAWNWRKFGRVL
ncbi:hypothetical protein KBD61_03945 [Patescibacteria group bacterium]|nr:hypothetical protein [Patescibacteria group bacterium]MBP9710148.1 hypothetical protein [Patescibacteria group bacterium]